MSRNADFHAQARALMPGGVSSPVRAWRAVGGTPLTLAEGDGCRVVDADGRTFIDYVGAFGPLLLGHAHPAIVMAVRDAAGRGTAFGAPVRQEIELARLIVDAVPGVERMRFVCSGTEAAMTAARLARAATGRDLLVMFAGGYHGHADHFLAQAGSGLLTLGIAATPGVPAAAVQATAVLPYNDLAAVREFGAAHGARVAAVFVEPVAGNMGCVPPEPGFLAGLRALTRAWGAVLVFDEVITGFRVAWGGVQPGLGFTADLTLLGKVIGGGLPVGAVAGPARLLDRLAPEGDVYQAGTLAGNPLAMAAGAAMLRTLRAAPPYEALAARSARLAAGLREAAGAAGVPVTVNQHASLLTVFFTRVAGAPVRNAAEAAACDRARFARFFHAMVDGGVLLPPSPMECWMVSAAHDDAAIEATLAAAAAAFRATTPGRT